MRNYTLRMKEYGLSPARVRELKAFCEQYEEKRRMVAACYDLTAVAFDAPTQGGTPGNPTEKRAIKAQRYKKDLALIDECLQEAADGSDLVMDALKRNVTRGVGFDRLGIVYTEKNTFYLCRRKFFHLLDQKLNKKEETA